MPTGDPFQSQRQAARSVWESSIRFRVIRLGLESTVDRVFSLNSNILLFCDFVYATELPYRRLRNRIGGIGEGNRADRFTG